MQKVEFTVPDGMLVYGGLAITSALNAETGEHTLYVSEFGDQRQSQRIGLLQSVLDRERERMKQTWDGES